MVAFAAIAAAVVGNAILLATDVYELALVGRLIVGIGSGAGFVAGLDLVRAGGGGAVARGAYGGATMAGGGLALMIVPALTDATGWRATYFSALVLAIVAAIPVLAARTPPVAGAGARPALGVAELLPLGVLQTATFGLAVVAGVWVVPLLERQDVGSAVAGLAGSTILLAGVVTRPWGGRLSHQGHSAERIAYVSLAGCVAGAALLAAGGPLVVSATGALLLGLGAGLPFSVIFAAAQRLRPEAPGVAVATVNGIAVLTILVGTPVAGLAFDLPGDGRLAFAGLALGAAAALAAVPRARLDPR